MGTCNKCGGRTKPFEPMCEKCIAIALKNRREAQDGNERSASPSPTQSVPITEYSITNVNIVDLHIPFGSMVVLTIKWAIAAIPATLILAGIYFLVASIFLGGCAAVLR